MPQPIVQSWIIGIQRIPTNQYGIMNRTKRMCHEERFFATYFQISRYVVGLVGIGGERRSRRSISVVFGAVRIRSGGVVGCGGVIGSSGDHAIEGLGIC